MTDNTNNEQWYERYLNKFYKWLEEKYPDIYEKYHSNFSYPSQRNGGFSVTNNNKISDEEYKKINEIADEFYNTTPDA
jgi:hypothetical protein